MISTSKNRWKKAQYAESEFYRIPKKRIQAKPSLYLNRQFLLDCDFFNDKTILEIGCAIHSAVHTIEGAYEKVGIDPLANTFGPAYPRCAEHIQGRGEELPFKDETFDVIMCLNTLDHTQNPYKVLKEIRRCLKRTGTLLFYVNTFSTFKTIRKKLGIIDAPHPHHFSDSEVSYMFQRLGFDLNKHMYKKVGFDFQRIKQQIRGRGVSSAVRELIAIFFGLGQSWYMCLRR
ncbi:MAG: class I SAM-dependent methyltransferase [Candidatus Bathyarchaeota archaeon]|nr:class I SAM-dependent methyltransferase [Candidatus Bathyarchaeota archaeon]